MTWFLVSLYATAGLLQLVAIFHNPPNKVIDVSWTGKPIEKLQVTSMSFIASGTLIGSIASIVWLLGT